MAVVLESEHAQWSIYAYCKWLNSMCIHNQIDIKKYGPTKCQNIHDRQVCKINSVSYAGSANSVRHIWATTDIFYESHHCFNFNTLGRFFKWFGFTNYMFFQTGNTVRDLNVLCPCVYGLYCIAELYHVSIVSNLFAGFSGIHIYGSLVLGLVWGDSV